MAEFDDKVAVETRGASGIGRAAAERRRNSVVGVCGGNGGRHALRRTLAIETADDGIRVQRRRARRGADSIYGGFMSEQEVRDVLPTFPAMHPLGRIAEIGDVVEANLFRASSRAAFIIGAVVPVDGGVTAGLPAAA